MCGRCFTTLCVGKLDYVCVRNTQVARNILLCAETLCFILWNIVFRAGVHGDVSS